MVKGSISALIHDAQSLYDRILVLNHSEDFTDYEEDIFDELLRSLQHVRVGLCLLGDYYYGERD